MSQGSDQGGWLKWFALVVLHARVMGRHPGFAPSSPEVAVGWGEGGLRAGRGVAAGLVFL